VEKTAIEKKEGKFSSGVVSHVTEKKEGGEKNSQPYM
jgi:hypothetical protein